MIKLRPMIKCFSVLIRQTTALKLGKKIQNLIIIIHERSHVTFSSLFTLGHQFYSNFESLYCMLSEKQQYSQFSNIKQKILNIANYNAVWKNRQLRLLVTLNYLDTMQYLSAKKHRNGTFHLSSHKNATTDERFRALFKNLINEIKMDQRFHLVSPSLSRNEPSFKTSKGSKENRLFSVYHPSNNSYQVLDWTLIIFLFIICFLLSSYWLTN